MGRKDLALATVTNWTFLALQKGEKGEARTLLNRAHRLLSEMEGEGELPSAMVDLQARLLAHDAKLTIQEYLADGEENTPILDNVNTLYSKACAMSQDNDHRRTNIMIEWADELITLHRKSDVRCLQSAEDALEKAHRGLDTHICDLCLGYFHQVSSSLALANAEANALLQPKEARPHLEQSLRHGELSLAHYQRADHPYTQIAAAMVEDVTSRIKKMDKPDRVFLSHKSSDKALVRRFGSALRSLGYRPWIDEEAMTAGASLDRALLQGFKDSCAAIFFVTPEFEDDGFLATEIDYAIQQERERQGQFRIIAIVFRDTSGKTGAVPELLKRFVYKHPEHDLQALEEIVRAIPLTLPPPRWST
jgi:hypothetical protein